MAGSVRDVKQVIVRSLTASATVRALVDGRVYATYLREVEGTGGKRTYPILTIEDMGGLLGYEAYIQEVVFTLVAWSQVSSDEALAVYEAAQAVIQANRLTLAGVTAVVVCEETARPIDGWSEGHQCWYCSGRWLARTNG